ncbi:MAG: diguanylate cyclase [Holophagaceae bacterium]|nr:diguanylate cyclase [Holophagaceae bacterium]
MPDSSLCRSEQDFDLFDHEKGVILRATRALERTHEDTGGLRIALLELVQAYEKSARELKRLMRTGDRQQDQLRQVSRELQEKSRLMEEQARHLLILNTDLAHEVEARKALEIELRVLATTDPLTGVYNRRRFLELGDYEMARDARNHRGLSLLALDIDHFKRINDTHGHGAGDATLLRFAQACSTCLRAMDTIGRLGGEEFAVLLPETPLEEAREVAERMRLAVESCRMTGPQGLFGITVSIGVVQLGPEETFEALAERADARLYAAKHQGRNRVES